MSGNVIEGDFPRADPFPRQTHDVVLDQLELEIVRAVVEHLHHAASLVYAVGLAQARKIYLAAHPELCEQSASDHLRFLASLMTQIRALAPREQAKLRHPARDRAAIDLVMRGGNG